jgi:hypothetical protein
MSSEPQQEKESIIVFWGTDPNALLDPASVMELFPMSTMTYNQKLNAISRLVIILTILFYFVLNSFRVFIIGILTLGAIWFLHYTQQQKDSTAKKVRFAEGFNDYSDVANEYLQDKWLPTDVFAETTRENPFQNVLMTDYDEAGMKKPAQAAFSQSVQKDVMEHAKNMIDSVNPEQPKISEKLFRSLEDNLAFEQSMRPFYSTAATTIPNDQGSFADFCYGSMVSCKDGNPFACARQLASRYTN